MSAIIIVDTKRDTIDTEAAQLVVETARKHGLTVRSLIGPGRHNVLVNARADAAIQMRKRGWSYQRIGEVLGGRHHTTIMNLVQTA